MPLLYKEYARAFSFNCAQLCHARAFSFNCADSLIKHLNGSKAMQW